MAPFADVIRYADPGFLIVFCKQPSSTSHRLPVDMDFCCDQTKRKVVLIAMAHQTKSGVIKQFGDADFVSVVV